MADLTSANVSFTEYNPSTSPLAPARKTSGGPNPRISAYGVIAFGDGALTYPTGGIPIDHSRLSMPAFVENITFPDATDAGSGTLWQYDQVNQKIRGYSALGTEISGAVAAKTLDAVITGF